MSEKPTVCFCEEVQEHEGRDDVKCYLCLEDENAELKAKVGRLTKVLREVRDAVPKICQAQLGRDCNCGAATHIIDNALMESDEED